MLIRVLLSQDKENIYSRSNTERGIVKYAISNCQNIKEQANITCSLQDAKSVL